MAAAIGAGSGLSRKRAHSMDEPDEVNRKMARANDGRQVVSTNLERVVKIRGLCTIFVSYIDPARGYAFAAYFHPDKCHEIFKSALKEQVFTNFSSLLQIRQVHFKMTGQRNLSLFALCQKYLDLPKLREFAFDPHERKMLREFVSNQDGARVVQKHIEVQERAVAAKGHHATLQFCLGLRQEFGIGMAKDPGSAFKSYKTAAEGGNADAQFKFGNVYDSTVLTSNAQQKNDIVIDWFTRAAEQGHVRAQYILGLRYEKPPEYVRKVGVSPNRAQAEFWYRRAAQQGHKQSIAAAQKNLCKAMQNSLTPIRQASSASDGSRVGVSPTTSESDSVTRAEFNELLDRPLAVRKCAASAV